MLKPLFTSCEICGVDGLHADEDPLAAGGGDEVDEFFVAQQIGADLRDPMHLRVGGDDVAQERLGAFDVDGEIVVDEEDGDLAALALRALFQFQQFVHDAFVGAKADGIAEKSGHGAEFASVRTAAAGFDRDKAKRPPSASEALQQRSGNLGNDVELVEIDGLPRNHGIGLKRGFAFLAELIHGSVEILELAAHGIRDDLVATFRRLRRGRPRRHGEVRHRGRALRRIAR